MKLLRILRIAPLVLMLACVSNPQTQQPPAKEEKPSTGEFVADLSEGVKLKARAEVVLGLKTCRFAISKPGSSIDLPVAFTGKNSVTITPERGFPIKMTKVGNAYRAAELHSRAREGLILEEELPPPGREFRDFYDLVVEACDLLPVAGAAEPPVDQRAQLIARLGIIGSFLRRNAN